MNVHLPSSGCRAESGRRARPVVALLLVLVVALVPGWCAARAAAPELVGILALAADEEVARELGLSDEQQAQLLDLIDQREGQAVDLVVQLRDLGPEEQEARLAPFREESEGLGLALLSAEQRRALERIRIRRLGLAALGEPAVAEQLALTSEQQARVAQLLEQRAQRLARADEQSLRTVRAEMELRLAAVLTEHQRAAWEILTDRRLPAQIGPGAGPPGETLAGVAAEGQPAEPSVSSEAGSRAEAGAPSEHGEPAEPGGPTAPVAETEAPPTEPPEPVRTFRFEFHYQPWKDVLELFARQADLSLVMDAPPSGTFNYTDERSYTPAEAIDLLNSILLTKGYTLVRRERMLMLINLEDGIPPNLVSTIRPEDLDQRGEYELVRVLFDLNSVTAEEAEAEIKKLLGPQGAVVPLPQSRQILVTETAGRLRAIRALLQRIEDPRGITSGQIRSFELEYVTPDEVLDVARQLLEIPEDSYAAEDGSIRLAVDTLGNRLLATGRPEKLGRLQEVVEMVDVPLPGEPGEGLALQAPQLEVYSVSAADPEAVLAVMQTLLAGLPDVRLALDPKTGNLVAHARPSEHATIRATLEQMQRDARQVEVIPLRVVDPQLAVLAINKLFGAGGEKDEQSTGNAPQVDADPVRRQLLVRGTKAQIEQIRTLLDKMGESEADSAVAAAERGNVRMLPVHGRAAQNALEQLQQIWPSLRANPIRVVTPSAVIPSYRPSSGELPPAPPLAPQPGPAPAQRTPLESQGPSGVLLPEPTEPEAVAPERVVPRRELPLPSSPGTSPEMPVAPLPPAAAPVLPAVPEPEEQFPGIERPEPIPPFPPAPSGLPGPEDPTARGAFRARMVFVSQPIVTSDEPSGQLAPAQPAEVLPDSAAEVLPPGPTQQPEAVLPSETQQPPVAAASDAEVDPSGSDQTGTNGPAPSEPAPIIVSVGPGGVMIASDDIEALDAFEQLFNELAAGSLAGTGELTVFYLKHAKASLVAEMLDQVFGGGTLTEPSGESEGGGRSMLGDMASAALGDTGGGIIGALLGMGEGGTIAPSGMIRITPDNRLNALIVQANAADLATIEQLLQVLDQRESPEEVLVVPKVKVIPVFNTQAEEIAAVVKDVYQDRMVTGPQSGGAQRPPSPQELFEMLRRSRGGGSSRSRGGGATEEVQRLALSVDTRTNSLVLAAPEPLFTEVQQVIEQMDQAAVETNQAIRVITLHHTSPEAVRRAISAATGETIQFGSGSSRSGYRPSSSSSSGTSSSSSRYGSSSGYRRPGQ